MARAGRNRIGSGGNSPKKIKNGGVGLVHLSIPLLRGNRPINAGIRGVEVGRKANYSLAVRLVVDSGEDAIEIVGIIGGIAVILGGMGIIDFILVNENCLLRDGIHMIKAAVNKLSQPLGIVKVAIGTDDRSNAML